MKILQNIRQRAAQAAVTVLLVEVRVGGQDGGVGLCSRCLGTWVMAVHNASAVLRCSALPFFHSLLNFGLDLSPTRSRSGYAAAVLNVDNSQNSGGGARQSAKPLTGMPAALADP